MAPATSTRPVSPDTFAPQAQAWMEAWNLDSRHWLAGAGPGIHPPEAYLRWLDGGSFLPPLRLLAELEPSLPALHRDHDPRQALAEAFIALWNRVNPFAPIAIVQDSVREARTDLWLEADLPVAAGGPDLASLLPACLKVFPRAFGLPAFEEVQTAADPRPVEAGHPSPPLFHVGFSRLRAGGWNPLSRLIRDLAAREGAPMESPTRDVPSRELGAAAGPASHRFVYHHADDSISCDGRHLARQVPARILRRLVRDFLATGRREFEFRALKRDPEIVTNRKRPNFEVRLRRVQEVIRRAPCGLVLHHRRPGLLELEATSLIEFSEE